jgi:hypothetical protein
MDLRDMVASRNNTDDKPGDKVSDTDGFVWKVLLTKNLKVAALEECNVESISVTKPVIVQTDQRSLLYINHSRQAHCVRWRNLYLKNHSYILEWIPGEHNGVSDNMSRWFIGPGRISTTGFKRTLVDLLRHQMLPTGTTIAGICE